MSQLMRRREVPASERVIDAVADREGVAPEDLETPLFEAVDPDALDALFDNHITAGELTFEYTGYRVTVAADGTVSLS